MTIGIIDADLISRPKHRFPNLASMKISGYHKSQNDTVKLLLNYNDVQNYDKIYISKVFTDTEVPFEILTLPNVQYGGTGFFFDKAEPLPYEIEHHMPDYHLYDDWVDEQIKKGVNKVSLKEYTDYSIGFITRGCFRKCPFCVNQNYNKVTSHSPVSEFLDLSRKKICLLDDNFFGCSDWKNLLQTLIDTGKPFKFKQGMDERIMTDEKAELLFSSKYDGDFTFAFDNLEDYNIIESKLKMMRKYSNKIFKFYVICAFDRENHYDTNFYKQDIISVFKRIELLGKYGCIPYITRFEKYNAAPEPYRGMYITFARWCNQPAYFKKESLYEYITITDFNSGGKASTKYMNLFKELHPDVFTEYFNKKIFIKEA